MKISAYLACSIDGFIARKNHDVDWLDNPRFDAGGDYGFAGFYSDVSCMLMGRNTFDKVASFDFWPYDKTVNVLTHRPLDLPNTFAGDVQSMQGEPAQVAQQLTEQGAKHLYVDGGITVQQFLHAGLLDEITITRIPVILGSGIALFDQFEKDIDLHMIETRVFKDGLVQTKFALQA